MDNCSNPLLLSPVILCIFRFLPIRDIKRLRLVNKTWANEGFHYLRHHTFVNLTNFETLQNYLVSPERSHFTNFSFKINDWTDTISDYFSQIEPSYLAVILYDSDDGLRALDQVNDLLKTQPNSFKSLTLWYWSYGNELAQTNTVTILKLVSNQMEKVLIKFDEYRTFNVKFLAWKFPAMKNLKFIEAPLIFWITPEKFPKLRKIRTNYFSLFHLDDWSSFGAHPGVTDVTIDIDNLFHDGSYCNPNLFEEFLHQLKVKFPNFINLKISAVDLDLVKQYPGKIAEISKALKEKFQIKSFQIESYYDCFNSWAEGNPKIFRDLFSQVQSEKILDFNPETWPEEQNWRKFSPFPSQTFSDNWLNSLGIRKFRNLQVLKLLWVKDLFTVVGLEDPDVMPFLKHFEFIGNKCINTGKKALVQRRRPKLVMRQHIYCLCEEENEIWCMEDPDSGVIFENLFIYDNENV